MDQGEFMQGMREEFQKFVAELRDTLNQTASGSPPIGSTSPTATRDGNILQTLGLTGKDVQKSIDSIGLEQEVRDINSKMDTIIGLLESGT